MFLSTAQWDPQWLCPAEFKNSVCITVNRHFILPHLCLWISLTSGIRYICNSIQTTSQGRDPDRSSIGQRGNVGRHSNGLWKTHYNFFKRAHQQNGWDVMMLWRGSVAALLMRKSDPGSKGSNTEPPLKWLTWEAAAWRDQKQNQQLFVLKQH